MTKEDYLEHVKNNVLRNREPDVYDIEDAYMEGYSQACYEAVYPFSCSGNNLEEIIDKAFSFFDNNFGNYKLIKY